MEKKNKTHSVLYTIITVILLTGVLLVANDFNVAGLWAGEVSTINVYKVRVNPKTDPIINTSFFADKSFIQSATIAKSVYIDELEDDFIVCADVYGDSGISSLSGRVVFSDDEESEGIKLVSVPSSYNVDINSLITIRNQQFRVMGKNTSMQYCVIPEKAFINTFQEPEYVIVRCYAINSYSSSIINRNRVMNLFHTKNVELINGNTGLSAGRILFTFFLAACPFILVLLRKKAVIEHKTMKTALIIHSALIIACFMVICAFSATSIVKEQMIGSAAKKTFLKFGEKAAYYEVDWTLIYGPNNKAQSINSMIRANNICVYSIYKAKNQNGAFDVYLLDKEMIKQFIGEKKSELFSRTGISENGQIECIVCNNCNVDKAFLKISSSSIQALPRLDENSSPLLITDLIMYKPKVLVCLNSKEVIEQLSLYRQVSMENNYFIFDVNLLSDKDCELLTQYGTIISLKKTDSQWESYHHNRVLGTALILLIVAVFIISTLLTVLFFLRKSQMVDKSRKSIIRSRKH